LLLRFKNEKTGYCDREMDDAKGKAVDEDEESIRESEN
jgi:hypothetical protein